MFDLLRDRIAFRYASVPPTRRGTAFLSDMRELPRLVKGFGRAIRFAITSPPYLDITKFEEDQWLRLWFLGGKPRPTYGVVSRDDRHERPSKYWNLVSDMWRVLGQVLGKKAEIVIRLGAKKLDEEQLGACLKGTTVFSQREVSLLSRESSVIRRKQTGAFLPDSEGCLTEVDFHFRMK